MVFWFIPLIKALAGAGAKAGAAGVAKGAVAGAAKAGAATAAHVAIPAAAQAAPSVLKGATALTGVGSSTPTLASGLATGPKPVMPGAAITSQTPAPMIKTPQMFGGANAPPPQQGGLNIDNMLHSILGGGGGDKGGQNPSGINVQQMLQQGQQANGQQQNLADQDAASQAQQLQQYLMEQRARQMQFGGGGSMGANPFLTGGR